MEAKKAEITTEEVQAVEALPVVMSENERSFAVQVLKDVNSTFDLATTVMAIQGQISIPENSGFKVTGSDVMQFMALARAMHLNPILGGIYGFKDKNGRLTLGVSKKGWQQALESQPDYAGVTWVNAEMQEKRVSDGRNTSTIHFIPWSKCIVKKILKNGSIGEFEGTAYFDEEFDPKKPTWMQKSKRMLETRALTIAASNAYGWGAYMPDELAPITGGNTFNAADSKKLLLEQIKAATSYEEIIKIYKSATSELKNDPEVLNTCKTVKAEIENI